MGFCHVATREIKDFADRKVLESAMGPDETFFWIELLGHWDFLTPLKAGSSSPAGAYSGCGRPVSPPLPFGDREGFAAHFLRIL